MAIIKCPECGKKISDKARVCVHCGYPLLRENGICGEEKSKIENKTKPDYLKISFMAAVLIVLMVKIAELVCEIGIRKWLFIALPCISAVCGAMLVLWVILNGDRRETEYNSEKY